MQNILQKIKEIKEKIFKKEHLEKVKTFNYPRFFTTASYGRTVAMIGILILMIAVPITVTVLGKTTHLFNFAYCPADICGGGGGNSCTPSDWWGCGPYTSYCHYYKDSACNQTYNSCKAECGKCGYNGSPYTNYGVCHNQQVCDQVGNSCSSSIQYINCTTHPGQCGAPTCNPTHTTGVCNGQRTCDADGNTCSTYVAYSNCSVIGGQCGAPQCSGTCMYGGCPAGNGDGFCSSTSLQCCKVPPPTPTPVPACKDLNGGKGFCSTGGCGAGDAASDHGVSNYSGCGNYVSCCWGDKSAPTQGTGDSCTNAAVGGQCYFNLSGCPADSDLKTISGSDPGRCPNPQFCCVKKPPNPNDCPSFVASSDAPNPCYSGACTTPDSGDTTCSAYVIKKHAPKCQDIGGYQLSVKTETSWFVKASKIYSCIYHQTPLPVFDCGLGNKNNAYCSHGTYNDKGELSCPTGQLYTKGNYSGCGNYTLCCVNNNSLTPVPPAPTTSPETQCQNAGGQCYFNLSGCPANAPNLGRMDCNAPTFCCKGIPIASGPTGCDPAKTDCTSNTDGGGGSSGGTNPNPTQAPTCQAGKSTQFAMNIKLPGIGGGDFENHSPKHTTKHASIVIKDDSGNLIQGSSHDFSHSMSHANGNGKLSSERVDLSTKLACSKTYHVEVKIPGYVTVKKDIAYGDTGQTLEIAENDIIPGDIVGNGNTNTLTPDNQLAGDDVVDLADYNIFRQCHDNPGATYQVTNNTQQINITCSDLINLYDFQDGGVGTDPNTGISEFAENYNLWLRGYLKFQGN